MHDHFISIVMPLYNEEKFIGKCIDSLLLQDYPRNQMEWIFVDGMSTDRTREILSQYQSLYPELIRIFENPHKIVPYAMNIGISQSRGRYIVRLDAHAEYASDYISRCIFYLDTTDADNVGGVAETKACGFQGNAIAKVLSSKFGVGNSQFRTNGKSGYVDTVPFGAFRREVFRNYGGYDERLVRNQDNEMNFRIRKNGGKIFLADDIHLAYYCRDSIGGISRMALSNGTWNVITMKLCPGSMGLRHFIPFLFVLSNVLLIPMSFVHPFFLWCLALEWGLYLALDILFSARAAGGVREFFMMLLLFPVFHISYGCGSVRGLFRLAGRAYRSSGYTPPKI